MDWLNWTVRAFTVIGGAVAILCLLVGAKAIINVLISSMEIWSARKKFHQFQKAKPEMFKKYLEHGGDIFEDAKNEAKKDDA